MQMYSINYITVHILWLRMIITSLHGFLSEPWTLKVYTIRWRGRCIYSNKPVFWGGNFHGKFMSRALRRYQTRRRSCETPQEGERKEGQEEAVRSVREEESEAGRAEGRRRNTTTRVCGASGHLLFWFMCVLQPGVPQRAGEWVQQLWRLAAQLQPVPGERRRRRRPERDGRGQDRREVQSEDGTIGALRLFGRRFAFSL